MNLKQRIKRKIQKVIFGNKASSEEYVFYLRNLGMKIGDRVVIFSPRHTLIDETSPWMIEIGNDVQIPHGVTILTHGYDWSVLKGAYGDVLGSSGGVKIGNNVFIGMNTTILKGTTIGDNVIIGAGSVVSKSIPNNCVAVGNPCRVIMTLEEYHQKRINAQEQEAIERVQWFRKIYGKNPEKKDMSEFFWLFSGGNDSLDDTWKKKMQLVGNAEFSYKIFQENDKKYDSFKAFLESVK